jgi:hypothetical protein
LVVKVYLDEVKDGGPANVVPATENGRDPIQVVIEE